MKDSTLGRLTNSRSITRQIGMLSVFHGVVIGAAERARVRDALFSGKRIDDADLRPVVVERADALLRTIPWMAVAAWLMTAAALGLAGWLLGTGADGAIAILLAAWVMSESLVAGAALAGVLGIGVAYAAAKIRYRSR